MVGDQRLWSQMAILSEDMHNEFVSAVDRWRLWQSMVLLAVQDCQSTDDRYEFSAYG